MTQTMILSFQNVSNDRKEDLVLSLSLYLEVEKG